MVRNPFVSKYGNAPFHLLKAVLSLTVAFSPVALSRTDPTMPAGPLGPAQAPLQLNNNNTKVIAGSESAPLLSRPDGGDPVRPGGEQPRGICSKPCMISFSELPAARSFFSYLTSGSAVWDASRAAGGWGRGNAGPSCPWGLPPPLCSDPLGQQRWRKDPPGP